VFPLNLITAPFRPTLTAKAGAPLMQDVLLTAPVRTPIGNVNGALRAVSATALGSRVIHEIVQRATIDAHTVDEVIMGNVLSAGLGQAPARQAALGAGLPDQVDATTVNKMCGSGLKAIIMAAEAIHAGSAKIVIAGGMESMRNVPYLLAHAREGYHLGHAEVTDGILLDGLQDVYSGMPMAALADRCAGKYGTTRLEQDEWAIRSYERAGQASRQGWFSDELVEVVVPGRTGDVHVSCDERLNKFNEAKLRSLPALFESPGTITAGNACGLNDGCSAMLVLSSEMASDQNHTPVAKLLAYSHRAVPPELFTTGPIEAIGSLLRSLRMSPDDIDLYEINEPFAMVPLITIKALGIDPARVNVTGGAISLGHPIGASGARIVSTLLHSLRRSGKRRGVASLCIGGGGGMALAVELIR
jgi:acetyl-CoA C-acetyltransferase